MNQYQVACVLQDDGAKLRVSGLGHRQGSHKGLDRESHEGKPGGTGMCPHTPPCPDASAPDREAAHTVVSHPEQGWSLLCNGVVIFEDTGELLPNGVTIAPHRPTDRAAR